MENKKAEQLEALETLKGYNVKILNAIKEVSSEFHGEEKADTNEYLNKILEGVNWIIQVINGTLDLINEKEELISKEKVNEMIVQLNASIKNNNKVQIITLIDNELYPFLDNLDVILNNVLS